MTRFPSFLYLSRVVWPGANMSCSRNLILNIMELLPAKYFPRKKLWTHAKSYKERIFKSQTLKIYYFRGKQKNGVQFAQKCVAFSSHFLLVKKQPSTFFKVNKRKRVPEIYLKERKISSNIYFLWGKNKVWNFILSLEKKRKKFVDDEVKREIRTSIQKFTNRRHRYTLVH